MKKEGILLIISGPSGSGKGTVVSKLIEKGDFCLSISATTRQPRDYETDGVHYFFHTKEEFEDGMCEYFENLGKGKFNAKNVEAFEAGYNYKFD